MNGKRLSLIVLGSLGGLLLALVCRQDAFALLSALLGAGIVIAVTWPAVRRQAPTPKDDSAKRTRVVAALERLLRMGNVSFDRRFLKVFVDNAWRSIEADPDTLRWAKQFTALMQMSCEETVAFTGNNVVMASAQR